VHEYSIVQSLIDRVEQEAAARRATAVRRLWVSIGDLSGVERELLRTAYDTFKAKTICDACALEIRPVAARWECPRCRSSRSAGEVLRCETCGEPARLVQGDEIILDRIEMEVNDV
jgi:hydrogenase nickel incorporation protein HypA/HybF